MVLLNRMGHPAWMGVQARQPRAEELGKTLILSRFLKAPDTGTVSDSGYASSHQPYPDPPPQGAEIIPHQQGELPAWMAPQFANKNTPADADQLLQVHTRFNESAEETPQPPDGQAPADHELFATGDSGDVEGNSRLGKRVPGTRNNDTTATLLLLSNRKLEPLKELEQTPKDSIDSETDSTMSSSSSTALGNVSSLVLRNTSNKMNTHLVGFFECLINAKLGFRSRQNSPGHAASGSMPPPSSRAASIQGYPKRRARMHNEDRKRDFGRNSEDEEDENDQRERKKTRTEESKMGRKIACPYIKRYPVQFATWRTCPGPGFDAMNRLK